MSQLPPPDPDDRDDPLQRIRPSGIDRPRGQHDDIRLRDDIDLDYLADDPAAGETPLAPPDPGMDDAANAVPPPPPSSSGSAGSAAARQAASLSRTSAPLLTGVALLGALIVALLVWRPWDSGDAPTSVAGQCAATVKAMDAVTPLEAAYQNLGPQATVKQAKDTFTALLTKGYAPLAQHLAALGTSVDGAKGATDEVKAQGKALVTQAEAVRQDLDKLVATVGAAQTFPELSAVANDQSLGAIRERLYVGPSSAALSKFLAGQKECAGMGTDDEGTLPTS